MARMNWDRANREQKAARIEPPKPPKKPQKSEKEQRLLLEHRIVKLERQVRELTELLMSREEDA